MTRSPAGWGRSARRRIARVVAAADQFVQRLNDRFTDPSGGANAAAGSARDLFDPMESESMIEDPWADTPQVAVDTERT
jgi:hypothetical protein